jgi:hypothetical protein
MFRQDEVTQDISTETNSRDFGRIIYTCADGLALNVSTKRLKSMDCDCLNRATQINGL